MPPELDLQLLKMDLYPLMSGGSPISGPGASLVSHRPMISGRSMEKSIESLR